MMVAQYSVNGLEGGVNNYEEKLFFFLLTHQGEHPSLQAYTQLNNLTISEIFQPNGGGWFFLTAAAKQT